MVNYDSFCNGSKTFGVVYKGSSKVVTLDNKPQYFRSRWTAERFFPTIQEAFYDSELEIIQFKLTTKEKYNFEKKRQLSSNILKRQKKRSRMLKNVLSNHSDYLLHLKRTQSESLKEKNINSKLEKKKGK